MTTAELPTSTELYAIFRHVFDEAEARIRAESGHTKHLGFSIHGGNIYGTDVSFSLRSGYATTDIEVRGRDFWDCVSEMIRRLQFATRQDALKLGPPTIDAEDVALISRTDVAS
jgi:hypothetical protein